MRFPCVLLLLAFAARPVGVAAHAELSDNGATDGRREVPGHLRIRAHDADDDERTGFQAKEIISRDAFNDATSLLKIPILDTSHEILNLETPDLSAKVLGKRKHSAEQISNYPKKVATEAIQAYEDLKQGKTPKKFANIFADFSTRTDRAKVYRAADNILLHSGYTPEDVFKMYMLHSAGDELFRPYLLSHWAKHLDVYNKAKGTKILMLSILQNYYSFRELVVAATKYFRCTFAKKVLSDLTEAALKDEVHPAVVFEWLRLKEEKENSGLKEQFLENYIDSYFAKFPKKTEALRRKNEISIEDIEIDDAVDTSIPNVEKVPMLESMLKEAANADLDTHK